MGRSRPCLTNARGLLSWCVGDGRGHDIADRATRRAVNTAVETAVDTAVSTAVERAVNGVVYTFVDRALTDALGNVRTTDAFTLDMFSGSWTVTLAGDANGVYQKTPTPPTGNEAFNEIGIGVRGVNSDGTPFYGLNLVAERKGETFVLVLLEAHGEGDTEDEVVQLVSLEVGGVTYAGEADVTLTEDSSTRIVGSFRAPVLTREGEADTTGALAAEGSFNVPINPAGSLIVTEGAAQPDS